MDHSLLSETTFIEADAYYDQVIAERRKYALLHFSPEHQFILLASQATNVQDILAIAFPAKQLHSTYRSSRNVMPTVRILTNYEHRCYWLANYFDVALSDIEAKCRPDIIRDNHIQRQLDFAPIVPPEFDPVLDEDLGG